VPSARDRRRRDAPEAALARLRSGCDAADTSPARGCPARGDAPRAPPCGRARRRRAAVEARTFANDRRGEVAVMHWVWLIIVGLVVGALGRALHPGKDPLGWLLTLALGVVSLIIAGIIFSSGVLEVIVGIVIAAVLLAIWS